MKLILFTNLSRMPYIRKNVDDFGNNGNNIAIVHNNNIAFYNATHDAPENVQVIFVNDEVAVGENEKKAIHGLIGNDSDIFVVFHKNTTNRDNQEAIFNDRVYQSISASHIPGSIYAEISEWASKGFEPEALTKIIEKHFPNQKLEAALEFLDQCETADNLNDDTLKILTVAGININEGSNISGLFGSFKEEKKDKKLKALRDAIFKEIGMEV